MIDIFVQKDVVQLYKNKRVVFMGDSNIRALYKDLLCLSHSTQFISDKMLKTKMENSIFGDKLLTNGPKTNGRSYREERLAYIHGSKISFYFLTCVYDKYVQDILDYISRRSNVPDVLIINSCLWDVTRWGPNGVELFKENLVKLMKELKRLLPDCLVIWVTAPPIACELRGGFLLKELEFLRYSLRFHVMEANQYARKIVVSHGFDVLDSHYHLKMQLHRRCDDGIHWLPAPVRYVTNLLLTHISLAWNVDLPHRYKSDIMQTNFDMMEENSKHTPEKEPNNKKKKSPSKVVSVIQKPAKSHSPERVIEIKKEKENLNSKTSRKKHQSGSKRKSRLQESHHAYLRRAENSKRSKRIRNWRSSSAPYSPSQPVEKFQEIRDDSILFEDQHDSGYFPSPKKSYSSGTSHSHYGKPSTYHRKPFPSSEPYKKVSDSYKPPLVSDYYKQPLVSDYYKPLLISDSYKLPLVSTMPFSDPYQVSFTQSSVPYYYEQNNRQVVISSSSRRLPYPFPNFNTQNFQPVIDFAQDVPLGFQF